MLPSPSSSLSLSPPAGVGHHRMSRQHSQHSVCSDDESDQAARSALEIRREKNRIKQRNLRLRRANQMAELERNVQELRGGTHELHDRLAALEASEAALAGWVRDLETALVANGQREHVESLRRMWASATPLVASESQQSSSGARDPLATLASAAASSFRPSAGQQQPRWEDEGAGHGRKRRRQDEEYSTSLQQHHAAAAARLPSPSRAMRIDQICLPLPRPSSQSPPAGAMTPEPWGWGHMPSLDHPAHNAAFHQYEQKTRQAQPPYEQKPRVVSNPAGAQDQHRSLSPLDRRPMSAGSSDGTTRSWTSPVQSFAVRL